MPTFDLHMHSDVSSDGEKTPAELAAIAKSKGLKTIALSDHDTVRNVKKMTEEAGKLGIEVIPAIEINTSLGDYCVHLLGYGIDISDSWINSLEENVLNIQAACFHERVARLEKKFHLKLDEEQAIKISNGKNPWFALIDQMLALPEAKNIPELQDYLPGGRRSSPAPVNFFWDQCQPGSDLYVKTVYPDLLEAIDKIHQAGGLAVVAHPFNTFYHKPEMLDDLVLAGLDGLEVYSNYHNPDQINWYLKYANEHNLLITCGSDYHGKMKPDIEMGEYHLEDGEKYLENLKANINNATRKA